MLGLNCYVEPQPEQSATAKYYQINPVTFTLSRYTDIVSDKTHVSTSIDIVTISVVVVEIVLNKLELELELEKDLFDTQKVQTKT